MLTLIAIANLMFILTAVQYFATPYMIIVLRGDSSVIYSFFSLTIISGPIIGAMTGGIITTKVLGGY